MSHKIRLFAVVALLALLLATGGAQAQGPEPTEPITAQAALGTAFTYQGRLTDGGSPASGTYDFRFRLYDAATGGSQVGSTATKGDVTVTDGLFTVQLDFGNVFDGTALWLEIGVRPGASTGAYTSLTPRQALTAAPYALSLRPGATIQGDVSGGALTANNTATSGLTYGVYGRSASTAGRGVVGYASATSGTTYGVWGESASTAGLGVYGEASATSGTTFGVYGQSASPSGTGVLGWASATGGTTYGVLGWSDSPSGGRGVYGYASATSGYAYGVYGLSASTSGLGVYGLADATSGTTYGVYGGSFSTSGIGVYGHARANSGTTYGVWGESDSHDGRGVVGYASATSGDTYGVYGESASYSGRGVYGYASANGGTTFGVWGESDSTDGRGVYGYANATSGDTYGVYGGSASTDGRGVLGWATAPSGTTFGVWGESDSTDGLGVYGKASATSGTTYGVYGRSDSPSGYAGYFYGRVHVTGNLSKGGGSFIIDHPLDPENKYLYHSFVESPDMKNIYDGVVMLDANGEAWVQLPEWFEALNRDFRYQLTPIGAAMPNLYIAEEIAGNRFKIAGGRPGMKVSWQVTGIRQDPYANAHRIPVEEEKPADERGTYLHPEAWGRPETMGLDYQRNADLLEQ